MAAAQEREITGAYREFEEATQKPFAWRRPFRWNVIGHLGWATGYLYSNYPNDLVHFYTNPEVAIPTAAITIATLIPYLRSRAKERKLNSIAVDIAEKEGRTPQAPTAEKYRASIILGHARNLSYPNPDLTNNLLALAEDSWHLADYLTIKGKRENQTLPDERQIAREISQRALRIARASLIENAQELTTAVKRISQRIEGIDAQIPKTTKTHQ